MKLISKILFCFLIIFTLFGCMQNLETNEVDHNDEQKQTIYNLAVESGYNGTYEEWLASIRGASIVLQVSNGYIQWASTDKSLWHNLVSLEELAGKDGQDGKETEFRVDSGYIQWKYTGDSTWTNLISLADITGQDGKNIELKVNNDVIQWRQEGSNSWQDLISLSSLSGEDGLTPEFKTTDTHLVWKYTIEAESEWRELLDLSTLKGETGKDGRTPEFRVHEGYMQWKYTDEDDTKWVNIMPYYVPEKEMVTVTYDYGNGVLDVIEYEKGSTIEEPDNPTKEGYRFEGWHYSDEKWKFDFYVITKDITLTAKWEKVYQINFYMDASLIESNYCAIGEEIEFPKIKLDNSYNSLNWYLSRTKTSISLPCILEEEYIENNVVNLFAIEEFIEEGATTINMWAADFEEWQNQLNIQQRMDFNDIKDDGIQLAQTFIQQSDIDDRLRSARETNSMPDIYMISLGNLYKEINRGNAADISSYINTWDDLVDNASEAVTYGGKKYGYPIYIEPSSLIFYRKDLLQQYGNTTEIPTKWDDFLELCGTIKKNIKAAVVKGVYAFDVPKGIACAWATVGMQASVTGGLAITDDWSESRLMGEGKEGYLALGNIWAELYGKGYIPLASGAYNEYITPLCLGNQVMTTAGSWSISEVVNSYPEMVDKIGVAVMPTLDGNQDVTTATNGGWAYVISTDCKNKEKAAEVIKFLVAGEDTSKTEEYFQKAYYSKSSPRKSVQAKIEASLANQTEVPAEWVEVVNEVAEKAVLEPIFSWDISVAIELYLEECAMGEDPLTKLKAADQTVKNVIKNDNLAGNNPRG